jgi:hypothetical protein
MVCRSAGNDAAQGESHCTDVLVKGAMAGLAFSSPRFEQSVTIPLAWVAGAGAHICRGTCERIR